MLGLLFFAAATAIPAIPDEEYGDWKVITLDNGTTIASVGNNAGSTFGAICTGTGCTSFFNPSIGCDPGSKYPALVNAPSSAFSVTLLCEKVGDLMIYSFPMEDRVTDAMSIGGVIGFASPMKSGEFKVARFSLTGAARSTARALQISKYLANPPKAGKVDTFSL